MRWGSLPPSEHLTPWGFHPRPKPEVLPQQQRPPWVWANTEEPPLLTRPTACQDVPAVHCFTDPERSVQQGPGEADTWVTSVGLLVVSGRAKHLSVPRRPHRQPDPKPYR